MIVYTQTGKEITISVTYFFPEPAADIGIFCLGSHLFLFPVRYVLLPGVVLLVDRLPADQRSDLPPYRSDGEGENRESGAFSFACGARKILDIDTDATGDARAMFVDYTGSYRWVKPIFDEQSANT